MIILASNSPRRKELMKLLTENYQVVPANIDETVLPNETPEVYAKRMSETKGRAILEQYPNDLILSADTIVVRNGRILGKPVNREEAKSMLQSYSGATHEVLTIVTILSPTDKKTFIVGASVSFYELTEEEIERYLSKDEWQDKAGAYGIQGVAALFVKEIKGDFFTIVGFPVSRIYHELQNFTVLEK